MTVTGPMRDIKSTALIELVRHPDTYSVVEVQNGGALDWWVWKHNRVYGWVFVASVQEWGKDDGWKMVGVRGCSNAVAIAPTVGILFRSFRERGTRIITLTDISTTDMRLIKICTFYGLTHKMTPFCRYSGMGPS
jgi:hypothetical protein